MKWAPCFDDVILFVLLKMAEITGNQKYADGVISNLEWFKNNVTRTPYGLPWLDSWGVLRYATVEAGLGLLADWKLRYYGYTEIAMLSIDYCLGDNPRHASYITNYLNNPPRHPNHRANEPNRDGVTNGMIGALVGGPDIYDDFDDYVNNYVQTEVTLDFNASFILALAGAKFSGLSPESLPLEDSEIEFGWFAYSNLENAKFYDSFKNENSKAFTYGEGKWGIYDSRLLWGNNKNNSGWSRYVLDKATSENYRITFRTKLMGINTSAKYPKYRLVLQDWGSGDEFSVWIDPKYDVLATYCKDNGISKDGKESYDAYGLGWKNASYSLRLLNLKKITNHNCRKTGLYIQRIFE